MSTVTLIQGPFTNFAVGLLEMTLRQCLLDEKKQNHLIYFGFLTQLMTESAVRDCLLSLGVQPSGETSIVSQIVPRALKLFSVLVLIGLEQYIIEFLKGGLTDESFPIYHAEELSFLKDDTCRLNFLREQWTVPPLLVRNRHLELLRECALPFVHKELSNNGSFGMIYKVKVADGHLSGYSSVSSAMIILRPSLTFKQRDFLALKTIVKREDESYDVVMREMETLRNRGHRNIVPLLASFTATALESDFQTRSLNMLFPYADMNMEEWMTLNQTPSWLKGKGWSDQRSFLYKSLYDILSGLAYLHREIDGMVTSHHDLKPRNILVVGETFMICDFGRAHLMPLDQGSETEGRSGLGTFAYHPPEYWNDDGTRASMSHGRAFDVWAMGCIMIEVVVLIAYGWESGMLKKFKGERSALLDEERRFTRGHHGGHDDSFHNSIPVIRDWLSLLQQNESHMLRETLRIAIQMLRASPQNRIYSWEAKLDMYELLYPDAKRSEALEEGKAHIQKPSQKKDIDDRPTPLHRASDRGNLDRVTTLLKAGWSPRIRDDFGHTPYDLAERNGHQEICDILSHASSTYKEGFCHPAGNPLISGPSSSVIHVREGNGFRLRAQGPNSSDPGQTKHFLAEYATQAKDSDSLHNAPQTTPNRTNNLSRALARPHTLRSDQGAGRTILHVAARKNDILTIQNALDKGAKQAMLMADECGKTPLHYASEFSSIGIVSVILKCSDAQTLLLSEDQDGRIPLHTAVKCKRQDVVVSLLDVARNKTVLMLHEDKTGETPWAMARRSSFDIFNLFTRVRNAEHWDNALKGSVS